MAGFRSVALVQSHQRLAPVHAYYLNDLVELCGLASVIRPDVERVELPVSPSDRDPLATFERYLRRQRPELVGISSFTCGANAARDYARLATEHGAFVVVGGFHPSASPDEVLAWPGVDAVVRGEGEEALAGLVRAGSPEGLPGLSYRIGERVVHQPVPPVIAELDRLPLPLRELRPERFGLTGLDYHTDTVYASRGCRGRCRFCANHLVGRTWRARSNDSILAELATITPPRRGPWKYVKFWDSNFLADPARIEALCHAILAEGYQRGFRFIAETRVEDVLRAEPILATMRRAGFVRLGCGVESPNRAAHRELGKGINLDHVARAAALLDRAEIQFTKFLIVGHPHETREDILAYPAYALSHGTRLQKTTVFVMTPYPGTELAAEYVAAGQVASFDWDLYTNLGSVVAPNGIAALELHGRHLAVGGGIALGVYGVAGGRARAVVGRLFEPLLVALVMARLNDRFTRDEVGAAVMTALARIPSDLRRAPPRRRHRRGDRLALRIHWPGAPAVVVGVGGDEREERLAVQTGVGRVLWSGRAVPEVHLSLAHLLDLVAAVDHRRLSHDLATLRWNRRAIRQRWLPSLARQLATVAALVARAAAFHASRLVLGPS